MQTWFSVRPSAYTSVVALYCMCSSLSVRPVEQQWRQLAVRLYSNWYCISSGVVVLARRIRFAMNKTLQYTPLFSQVWEQTLVSFCSNIFNSKSYDITGVSVTYKSKKNIGHWVAVQNRELETRDSKGAHAHTPTYAIARQ